MELENAACGALNPLADKIRAIMYLEAEKPIDSIDPDLIGECADFLAELEGMKRLTQNEIDSRVSSILSASHKNVVKKRSFRAILVAACLIIALLIANIIAVSFGGSEYAMFKFFSPNVPQMSDGERLNVDNMTIIKHGSTAQYLSVEEFFADGNYDILYPSVLPDGDALEGVCINPSYTNEDYTEFIYHTSNEDTTVTVNTDPELINSIKAISNITVEEIDGKICYIKKINDCVQGHFAVNGCTYMVKASSHEKLVEIVNGLKEYG